MTGSFDLKSGSMIENKNVEEDNPLDYFLQSSV
jgi:hypothetical protein